MHSLVGHAECGADVAMTPALSEEVADDLVPQPGGPLLVGDRAAL